MRAKLPINQSSTRAALFALAVFYSSFLPAQEINFQNSIDTIAEALILLDVKARDCVAALDADSDPQLLCDDFMAAIDGELLAGYIEQCRELKGWRDDYVEQTVASSATGDANDDEMLRRLVAVQYYCEEDTVLERTEFVALAFNRLRGSGSSTLTGTDAASINRQLSQSRFNELDQNERQRLLDSMQNQQRRSALESERQFNDLENELLRQQIRNSNRPPN